MGGNKAKVKELLNLADIRINGSRPWDIQIHNEKLFDRIFRQGSLGFGEAYMDGWWDAEKVDELICKAMLAKLNRKFITPKLIAAVIKSRLTNRQTFSRSKKVTKKHYDIGNDFYAKMLDKRMQYTCGYWKNAQNLEEAQKHKLDLVCRKLQLKPGDKVLELGCGWGGFAKYAAENYGCSVTAYNISEEQVKYAKKYCHGLPVEIILDDYRKADGKFDKVASIGLCEHVGHKNYRKMMKVVHKCLKDNGLFLLHTIGKDLSVANTDPWIEKYIFPNSMLPSVKQISTAAEGLFIMEDWHNFGKDYDKTLMTWYENFEKNWHYFKDKHRKRFYRMWKYYLLACAGNFRSRSAQLWQIVFSKNGLPGGYESVR